MAASFNISAYKITGQGVGTGFAPNLLFQPVQVAIASADDWNAIPVTDRDNTAIKSLLTVNHLGVNSTQYWVTQTVAQIITAANA
ncbi:MAG: hypothetical protein ACHQNT_13400 [Bacteroidia bacterium]